MGSLCLCIFLRLVEEALGYQDSVHPMSSYRPEKAEMYVILMLFGMAGLLEATYLCLKTDTILAFGSSREINSLVSLS